MAGDGLQAKEVGNAAGGEDQEIVGQIAAVRGHAAPFQVHSGHLGEAEADVGSGHDATDRMSDCLRLEPGGGYLVKEGDKGVVVVLIEYGDVDGRAAQSPRHAQPAEAGADDDDTRRGVRAVCGFFHNSIVPSRDVVFCQTNSG